MERFHSLRTARSLASLAHRVVELEERLLAHRVRPPPRVRDRHIEALADSGDALAREGQHHTAVARDIGSGVGAARQDIRRAVGESEELPRPVE